MTKRIPKPLTTEELVEQVAEEVTPRLLEAGQGEGAEFDFRVRFMQIVADAATRLDLEIEPRNEYAVARGHVDAVYNRLILEYKRPGSIKSNNQTQGNREIIRQVQDYILDVAKKDRREAHRLAGVATDGRRFLFVRRAGESWLVEDPVEVNLATTHRLLRLLFSLATGVALIPENLIKDFGPGSPLAHRAVKALYAALGKPKDPLVPKLFEQWQIFFGEATDYAEWANKIEEKSEFQSFIQAMGITSERASAPRVFFAIHTYYALLIKIIATLAISQFVGRSIEPILRMASKEGDALKRELGELESGGLFKVYGLNNFLEGDFFGWYLQAWNADIERAARGILQRLAGYDPATLELAPETARDLLKKLYHYLLPRDIRHDLGEFYTPDWLAEHVLRETLGSDYGRWDKRVLDPGCGSGTFLVLLIRAIRERAAKAGRSPAETLDDILTNVMGFDLNPLAVIASRTNYILALGDLLATKQAHLDIPVYQADSILTPSRGDTMFDQDTYSLPTAVGVFKIPYNLARREQIDTLTGYLDGAVTAGSGARAFLGVLRPLPAFDEQDLKAAAEPLMELYQDLRDLHERGLNGVWARIIKNAFAPIFIEPCHYVVGNPPWVNWEHLPDEYRKKTIPLWQHYGLFQQQGMATILGGGKKDLSMLMTYVAMDKYLLPRGKLGFVLSQSLFKSSGAGMGFRRFLLPDQTPFAPARVDDMHTLQPFEAASTRTVTAVFVKGSRVSFPVPYRSWKKVAQTGRKRRVPFEAELHDVLTEHVEIREWQAQPVDPAQPLSPWLGAPEPAAKALTRVLGQSDYVAHAGSFTGGANAVFWVVPLGARGKGLTVIRNLTEGAKRSVPEVEAAVESELVFPLLRGRDVARWGAKPSASILMTQDPNTRVGIAEEQMADKFPHTLAYFLQFKKQLRSRAANKGLFKKESTPLWAMFAVGPYTLASWKVVWREQADSLTAAVVGPLGGRAVVPDHKLMLIEVADSSEANYLCAMLNSSPARFIAASYAVEINFSPHLLQNIAIPAFKPTDKLHLELSALSERAHEAALDDPDALPAIEAQVDRQAAKLWGLTNAQLQAIQEALED